MEAPAEVLEVPSMLSEAELSMLYVLARDHFSGEGRIVDAGCFMGGSTVALSAGLRDRGYPVSREVITSYDRFEVEEYFFETFGEQLAGAAVGDDFRHLFDENVASHSDYVSVNAGDIVTHPWKGGPVELLFLDVLKTWRINDFVLENFFVNLIPGRSVVIQQDYLWAGLPFIHITMELLADYFIRLDDVPPSRVYLLREPIPAEAIRSCLKRNVSWDERHRLIASAIDREEGEARGMLELAAAWLPFTRWYQVPLEKALSRLRLSNPVWLDLDRQTREIAARYPGHERVQECAEDCLRMFAARQSGRRRVSEWLALGLSRALRRRRAR